MIDLARHIPAWLLTRLPVRRARQYAGVATEITAPTRSDSTLQLLVDVSVIHRSDARTGIQRVVRALLLQLLKMPPAGYRVCPVYSTRQHGYVYADAQFLDTPAGKGQLALRPVETQSGDVFLALDLAAHLLPRHQGQVLQWKRAGVKLHVLVYDLLPLQHPEWFPSKTERNFKRWIRWIAVYADNAICISENVKIELQDYLNVRFGLPAAALPKTTIALGADISASAPSNGLPVNAKTLLAHLRKIPSVLMVGTIEPRKGHDQALAAFERLWQQPGLACSLVLVGRAGWKTEALQAQLRNHPEAGKRLFWPENVSDEYLVQLYEACGGVLVASRAEGFGLPVIEAALYGKPILARDLPVFREIGLSGITFFADQDAESLACAIQAWLAKEHHEHNLKLHENVVTWQTSAKQLLCSLGLILESHVTVEENRSKTLVQGAVS